MATPRVTLILFFCQLEEAGKFIHGSHYNLPNENFDNALEGLIEKIIKKLISPKCFNLEFEFDNKYGV